VAHADAVLGHLVGGPVAGTLPDGHTLRDRAHRPQLRPRRTRPDAAVHRLLPAVLRLVCPHLSDGLAATGDDHAAEGKRTLKERREKREVRRDSRASSLYSLLSSLFSLRSFQSSLSRVPARFSSESMARKLATATTRELRIGASSGPR